MNKHLNVLITGSGGMLGKELVKSLSTVANVYQLGRKFNTDSNYIHLDLKNELEYEILQNYKFDIIIHAAAIVDLNYCESHPQDANMVHVRSTELLVSFFPEAVFYYVSTDSVYEGTRGNYIENDLPIVSNIYASTKLSGENVVLQKSQKPYVFRVNIYGNNSAKGGSLFEWAYLSLKNNIQINGFSNVYFNPVSVNQFSKIIRSIIFEIDLPYGLYNIGSEATISKYEFLQNISKVFSLDKRLVTPVTMSNENKTVKRPLNTSLNINKISAYLDLKRYSIENGLEEIKANISLSDN